MGPGEPQIPKWIYLRIFHDHICDTGPAGPMIPSCFTSRFSNMIFKISMAHNNFLYDMAQIIRNWAIYLNKQKSYTKYDYESNTNCLNQQRADWSVCPERQYYCESDLINVHTNTAIIKVNAHNHNLTNGCHAEFQ